MPIGEPEQDGQYIAEHVPLLAEKRKIDEAQIQIAVAPALQDIVIEQPGPAILGDGRRKRMEQSVEVLDVSRGVCSMP